jgi:hypothetical protein
MRKYKVLRLSDNAKHFYQWDTGRKLVVNDDKCTQVHFVNEYTELALTCQIFDQDGLRVVNVPNILLQVAKPITVYLNLIDEDGRLTSYSEILPVVPRKKPEDYIYTETEVLNYSSLVARIDQIEQNGVSDEQIASAVFSYLAENPVTPEGIGALPADELPEAINEALAQAKASGEFKGDPGEKGDPGDDYVLTPTDKQEIAEQAAELVEVPESGTVTDEQISEAVEDYLSKHPIDGNSNLLVVTFTEENGRLTPSHTYEQIKAWVDNSGHAVLTDRNTWYHLFDSKSTLYFERVVASANESTFIQYCITPLGYMGRRAFHYNQINVTAEVGQTIAVKSVDETGKPTEWEAVNMPTGGGGLDATIEGETLVFAESSTATIENETLIL